MVHILLIVWLALTILAIHNQNPLLHLRGTHMNLEVIQVHREADTPVTIPHHSHIGEEVIIGTEMAEFALEVISTTIGPPTMLNIGTIDTTGPLGGPQTIQLPLNLIPVIMIIR